VDRLAEERGFCGLGERARVSHHLAHHGEEPPLSGRRGAGTIFFSSCNLACRSCQNWQISQERLGREEGPEALAGRMLALQEAGCHNVELVSPSHLVPAILEALDRAAAAGLRLPLVYNTNGYDGLESLRLLDGVVDVYLPDAKYAREDFARLVSRAPRAAPYVEANRAALLEMRRQVGSGLLLDREGIARRGLIVRLLVLPGGLAGADETLAWIAELLGTGVWLSIMSQYAPHHQAAADPLLARRVSRSEYEGVVSALAGHGFSRYFLQDPESQELCVPDFERSEPFDFGTPAGKG
jgi:putative pyruvate formate lyase activating enzyme